MKGTFKVRMEKLDDFQWSYRLLFLQRWAIIWMVIILCGLLKKDEDVVEILIVGLLSGTVILLAACLAFILMGDGPFVSTEIEINEKVLIRRGQGLTTSEIELGKIGKLKELSIGLLVIKKGELLSYYTSKYNLTSNEYVVFIPCMTDNYTEIRRFLLSKA